MRHTHEEIGLLLKNARLKKKWSQEKLGSCVGLPQSHISKIEHGTVDLLTSSLIQLARALDLECMLIPKILVPSFEALMHAQKKDTPSQVPMYSLEDENNE